MSFSASRLPELIFTMICLGLLLNGPITQPTEYHRFADNSHLAGIPHAADVLSNAGFAVVGLAGWLALWPQRKWSRSARHGRDMDCSFSG